MLTKDKDGRITQTISQAEANRKGYFDITRDNHKSPFFCQACLVGKLLSERSEKDIRYCNECQPVIEYEYSLLSDRSHSKRYKPIKPETSFEASEAAHVDMDTGEEKTKMSTSNENIVTVDNFVPRGRPKTYKKRELPEELIKQLHNNDEGLGSKAIASKLKAEQGIDVSYKTIQRILAGQR